MPFRADSDQQTVKQADTQTATQSVGRVYFVGAGPGDPGLLTLRGRECLSRADVVLFDYLVNDAILRHADAKAELVCLGRHGSGRLLSVEEIVSRMIAEAHLGKTICRLKSGDPTIFARASEEIAPLEASSIPYEIVPGITAAIACSAYAGIPLTDRDSASAVAFVTGRQAEHAPEMDFGRLASFPGTLVFYMGVTSVRDWSAALLAAGKPAETPVMLVRRCSLPDQMHWKTTLSEAASLIETWKLRPPVTAVVGDVAGRTFRHAWFTERPLFGVTVLIARPEEQSEDLSAPLQELGAEVLSHPAITIAPPSSWQAVDAAIEQIPKFDWIVFASANGVRFFFHRLRDLGLDARRIGSCRIAAIGKGTCEALKQWGLIADHLPPQSRAESLAESLLPLATNRRVLIVRASRGRDILPRMLSEGGADVQQVVAYQSEDVLHVDAENLEAIDQGVVTCVAITSSAIARSLFQLLGPQLSKIPLVSISPVTTATLNELGLKATVEAETYDMPGVIQAIVKNWGASNSR